MPILSSEPQFYPECLFEQMSESGTNRDWWALHLRPRQEKSLARQLHANRIPFYLPLLSKRIRVKNRTLTSFIPLFPGYLFLFAEAEERVKALTTQRIVRSIVVMDQEKLRRELKQIHQLISSGVPVTPEERLVPGALVEIRTGPLAGLRGKILKSVAGHRFVVEVDFIQKGASVLLEDFTLAPVIE